MDDLAPPTVPPRRAADVERCLAACAGRHDRLCPRQVLGVRVGLAGRDALGPEVDGASKRLLVITETDGCFVTGLEESTGCRVGHRTLRVEDVGRVAAVFVDVATERAFRIAPQPGVRDRVAPWSGGERSRYERMMRAYRRMPDEDLLRIEPVRLSPPASVLVSRPHVRVACQACGEEVINERQVERQGRTLCRVCGGDPYYRTVRGAPSAPPATGR